RQAVQVVPQQLDPAKRDAYLLALQALITNPEMLVFGDEAHKTRAEEERRHGYYRRGGGGANVRKYITAGTSGGGNYTFFGAADLNGFVNEMCSLHETGKGPAEVDPNKGTVTSQTFYEWMRDYVAPNMGNFSRGEPRSVFVLDNAPVHFHDDLEDLAQQQGFYLLYLHPYGYDENPIEHCYAQYKSCLRKNAPNGLGMWELHDLGLNAVTRDNMIR
ncbi:hypothetical protein ScalyP_jg5473, partial [Parmales sp. scaly parma]